MKKRFLLLACVATLLTACNGGTGGNGGQTSSDIVVNNGEDSINRYSFTGVHDFDYEEGDGYIVRNRNTNYKIVIPADADSYIFKAKEELTELFEKATGVKLDTIVEDPDTSEHDPNGEYISIGDTEMFKTSGKTIDKEALGPQAARIITEDKTVYLLGGDNHGCIYAVYDLLKIYFDFDAYAYDCVHLDDKENLKFYNINVTDIPDIPMRSATWAFVRGNPNNFAYRLRTPVDFSDYFIHAGDTENGQNRACIHDTLDIIPPDRWSSEHPAWFSTAGKQLCFTARGDEEEYDALLNQAAAIIEKDLMYFDPVNYPLRNAVTFTTEDNHDVCQCPACRANEEKYQSSVGSVIVFCNRLRAIIGEWMDNHPQYARPDFKVVFFAYGAYIKAPVRFDTTLGKYVVVHPDLEIRDDVGVFYAISSGFNYQLDMYDERNLPGIDMFNQWADIAPSLYLWTYCANFHAYFSHVNTANFFNNDIYQFFALNNARLIYNQGGWDTDNLTAFQSLLVYLDAKLSWNSNENIPELIDRWFEGMYRDAASEMRQLYEEENAYALVRMAQHGKLNSTGIPNDNNSDYPQQLLARWLDYIKQARNKIEVYREINPSLFSVLKEHLDLEWVSPAYFYLSNYKADIDEDTKREMIEYFKTEILKLKDFLPKEHSTSPLSTWIQGL